MSRATRSTGTVRRAARTFAAVRPSLHHLGYSLLLLIGVAVWYPQWVQQGMYNDGLWYATIARNFSQSGAWWHPQLSDTFGAFVPHPPLVFWLEGGLFWIFGDHLWVERGYSLVVAVATAAALRWVWRQLAPRGRAWWWVPVGLWSVNEVVFNYYPNNLLDNTMALFALLSVGVLLRERVRGVHVLGAGGWLLLAVLAKGPVALFPLAVPGWRWLIARDTSFRAAAGQTAALLGVLGLVLSALWGLLPEVRTFFAAYYDVQLRGGLAGEQVYHARDNQLYILGKLVTVLLPAVLLTALVWLARARRHAAPLPYRRAGLLLAVGAAASVPLVFSPKQTYYYLLASLPYFYLAFGLLLLPSLRALRWSVAMRRRVLAALLVGIGAAAVVTHDSHTRVRGRHRQIYPDLQRIFPRLPDGATINSDEHHHTLLGYLARHRRVSVDTSATPRAYYLTRHPAHVPPGYRVLPLGTRTYYLYQRTE